MRGQIILDVRDLQVSFKVFGGKLQVLDGVNLSVARGERVGLVGEAGCGKTTTLKSIMRILPRQALMEGGRILYHDQNVLALGERDLQSFRRQGAAMIFQDPTAALNPVFTIGEQLAAGLRAALNGDGRTASDDELRAQAEKALSEVSLPDAGRIMHSYPFQLSGGMRQRVCIGMAIASRREILLADEPGTSLDVTIQDQILKLIGRLVTNHGLAVVLVTHSLGVVREMTDYVYIMYAGTIVEGGPTAEILSNPLHPYTMALLQCVPKLTGEGFAQGIPGRIPDYLNPPAGCRYSPRCPEATEECRKLKPAFNEILPDHEVACHQRKKRDVKA
jgi:peptide/nickel transport system ATP-binding protein